MELLFIVLFHDFLQGDYRVEQVAVFLHAVLCNDFSMLCDDKPTLLQQVHMLSNGVAGKM